MAATSSTLDQATLTSLDEWWRAANYLSAGQIYLADNPLLTEDLRPEHIKPRLLGHFGTTPGLNLVWAHANRVIRDRGIDALFIAGPGHGGPAMLANAWLDGGYTERYPDITQDRAGLRTLFRQFSTPGGVPSHAAPETPGSIHEGGELGYSLSHAYGAAFDNPDLTVFCVIGDGEAETGPLATAWHGNKFLHPQRDGTVLPILHLNGWKIANPTLLARIPETELADLLRGYGYDPLFVSVGEGEEPASTHRRFATVLDDALDRIDHARTSAERPRWPMIVLRSPKGWTGPQVVEGEPVEGTWRSHQVPLEVDRESGAGVEELERWMLSYRPDELFDEDGRPAAAIRALAPLDDRRLSMSPSSNGGQLRRPLELPDIADAAVAVPAPGSVDAQAPSALGDWLAEVIARNPRTFRVFSPDELASNRLAPAIYRATEKQWDADTDPLDEHLSRAGQIIEVLSEHQCQGWLEGYLLTGRHGLFASYEAFVHIIDSMFNQHAKWLEASQHVPWRRPIGSLNCLLSSHVWQQDHNGFTHQDPGFVDVVVNKSSELTRVYLPVDTNTLLATFRHCLQTTDAVNVVIAGKQPAPQWFDLRSATEHLERGVSTLAWAGQDDGDSPDIVLACAGDVPTTEVIAAAELLGTGLPALGVRVVNVIDLMRLQPASVHPHGLSDEEYAAAFGTEKPVLFAYHGYPWLIHRLTYRRPNHSNLHVRGYQERGTTTTPFDMLMLNNMDRYQLALDALDLVGHCDDATERLRHRLRLLRQHAYDHTREYARDIPAVTEWRFADASSS